MTVLVTQAWETSNNYHQNGQAINPVSVSAAMYGGRQITPVLEGKGVENENEHYLQ
jgi:hypothetical protein